MDPEEDKLRDKTNLTKKNGIVATMSTPMNRNPTKVQPNVVAPPVNTVPTTTVDTRSSTKISKKPPVEWRKTASAPVHEDEMNNSESESENQKSRQSNETEESEDYDDDDNATYDEKMSRLSLNDINTTRVSDSHSEDNDTEETSSPSSSETANHSTNNSTKQTVTDSTSSSTQHQSQKTNSNIYQDFDPNDLQGFADWLRLRFTDLLLDNSNDKNLPLNFASTTLPLLWNTPCAILGNSLNTRSRFDFARHEDEIMPHRSAPQTLNPIQSFHSAPPGYDHHSVIAGPYHHHHHPASIPQIPGPLRQPTLAHPFTNHTLPYHTQKTHI